MDTTNLVQPWGGIQSIFNKCKYIIPMNFFRNRSIIKPPWKSIRYGISGIICKRSLTGREYAADEVIVRYNYKKIQNTCSHEHRSF